MTKSSERLFIDLSSSQGQGGTTNNNLNRLFGNSNEALGSPTGQLKRDQTKSKTRLVI